METEQLQELTKGVLIRAQNDATVTAFFEGVCVGAKGIAAYTRNMITAGKSNKAIYEFLCAVIHMGDKPPLG